MALSNLRRSGASDEQIGTTMTEVFRELTDVDYTTVPPVLAANICRITRRITGVADPYAADKARYNAFAQSLLPRMRRLADSAPDPFAARVKLAIAANIIDFGKNSNLREEEVAACMSRALDTPVDPAAIERLRQAVAEADSILYLCDNTGEIVFDWLLMETAPNEKVTCVVRGEPVLNDATLDDASAVGLTKHVRVISNGSDTPGTVLEECSGQVQDAYRNADLVIAKGQGNYETLSDAADSRVFFLLQVKCPVIADHIGYPLGSFVVQRHCTAPDTVAAAGGGTLRGEAAA